MFCINCGVKLADSESCCPLCGVTVFHPDLDRPDGDPLYPPHRKPMPQVSSRGIQIVLTTIFLIPLLITLMSDLQLNDGITWSGFVIGALLVTYVISVMPVWFTRPNPVVFIPCSFAAICVYLLYINETTGGNWFLTFAFPITAGIGIIVTAVVALLRYLRRGRLYIVGGALILLGAFTLVMELLLCLTFDVAQFIGWSLYGLITLGLVGGMLIFLAINRPARETMERKFFI